MSFRACTEANDMKLARTSAAEDEIFVHRGLGNFPQQAETENPPTGGIFCFGPFLIRKALLAKETIEVLSPCFGWFALKKSMTTEKTKKLQSNKRKNIGECKEKLFTCAAVSGIMFPSILT